MTVVNKHIVVKKWLEMNEHVTAQVVSVESSNRGYTADGLVKVAFGRVSIEVVFDLKVTIVPRNIDSILIRHKRHGVNLFAAEYITKSAKEEMRKLEIPYLDSKGNFFFCSKEVFILVESERKKQPKEGRSPKAFSKRGLELVYHFIKNENLLNETYSEVEKRTGISVNTISRVRNSLNDEGFLTFEEGELCFVQKTLLIQEWFKYFYQYKDKNSPIFNHKEIKQYMKSVYDGLS